MMKPLSLIFMGSPDFAIPSLEKLHQSEHEILAVVSNPDKRRGRGSKPEPTPVKKKAIELGLETIDADDLQSERFHQQIGSYSPDLLVVVAFRILPKPILEIPKHGSVNLHASLLPRYRGAAPIHWAVMKGEKETGCTVFFLNEKVDTGEIIDQSRIKIGPLDTTGDIYEKLKHSGSELLLQSVNKIAAGSVETLPQDHSKATPAPKLYRENTKIDFDRPAEEVHNFIRGLSPFPGAWCRYGDEKMNVYRSEPVLHVNIPAGELLFKDGKLMAGCAEDAVELKTVQLPGTKKMSGSDFANGYSTDTGLT